MLSKMGKSLSTVEFLNENAIQNKSCDLDKPFVFLSYSHAVHDSIIVQNIFEMLYLYGFNAWIDVANIPFDQNSWQNAAFKALNSPNCKMAVFFRSENSLTKAAVADEVELILKNGYARLITCDIWTDPKMTAQGVYNNLQLLVEKDPDNKEDVASYSACERICKVVDPNNSAIRLAYECKNDSKELLSKIAQQLELVGLHGDTKVKKDEDDYDYDFIEKDGEIVKIANSAEGENDRLKFYVDIANEEIERNAKVFRDNDFGLLIERLKEMLGPIKEIEDNYVLMGKYMDKEKSIYRNLIYRRDIIFRIFLISFVVLSIIGVFVNTIPNTGLYRVVSNHVASLSMITGLFFQPKDEAIREFTNVCIISIVDAFAITVFSTLIPALVKSIILFLNHINVRKYEKNGERLINEKITFLDNFPLNYMCSFAIGYFIRIYSSRQARTIQEAMALFDEYKNSDQGIIEVAKIAPWLHYMREGINKIYAAKCK